MLQVRRLGILLIAVAGIAASSRAIDYERDVAPIFVKRCFGCHGPSMQMSGFRLDQPAAILKGGYGGPAILPGNSAGSKLILRVTGAPGIPAMPPAGPRLTPEEIQRIREWIDAGAPAPGGHPVLPEVSSGASTSEPEHWAFQPIRKPVPPQVSADAVVRNPIDTFLAARLEKEGIKASPEAAKPTLLRRLSLDLTGIPPTPEELRAFLADNSEHAYEKQVDRLLASPHLGEKWARGWLDQARYADSDGYEKDWYRPWAWRWRNWVIDAINQDMPFDRFTVEQIAGDLLPNATVEQRVATGFHRNTLTNREGGVDSAQFAFEAAVDRASTVGTVWLGLSVGCAQCHDHKFDPISQKDFYSLYAWFEPVEEVEIDAPRGGEFGPWLRTQREYQEKRQKLLDAFSVAERQAAWEKGILYTIAHPGERTDWDLAWDCVLKLTEGGDGAKIVRIPPARRSARQQEILTNHFVENAHFAYGNDIYKKKWNYDSLVRQLKELKEAYPRLTQAQVIEETPAKRKFFLRIRGDYKALGVEVEPATPATLPGQVHGTRLDLANWIVSKENPLTARVAVNRIWQEIFGTGIVATSDDFGTRSEEPSHPQLLDWLAATFRDEGWSRKRIIRLIVTSAAYRQSSRARPDLQETDPSNRMLARQSRLRLPAELIRDSALSVSGLLSEKIGGPSVRPPIPKGVMELSYASRYSGYEWETSAGEDRYRRGLYIQFLRTTPYPQLVTFDAPKAVLSSCRRDRSNTPLQALNLLNDPVFVEAAQALSVRTLAAASPAFGERLSRMWLLALGRAPSTEEHVRMQGYAGRQRELLSKDADAIASLAPMAAPGASRLDTAVWTGIASVVLNLDEFITRE